MKSLKKKHSRIARKMNAVFAVLIALLIAALFLLNAVSLLLSNRYPLSKDLTANAAYEIGEETKTVLRSLQQEITIDVLADESEFDGDRYLVQMKQILERYPQYSRFVSVRYIDYASDPSYAAKHADLTLAEGDVIVSNGEKVRQIGMMKLFNYAYTQSGSVSIESCRAEEAITSAILNVITDAEVRIGVLTGHGEQDVANLIALLVNNNYTVSSVVAATDSLTEYDLLLLAAPQTDLSETDIRALENYLYNGGEYGKNLFYSASVTQTVLPNLETFLSEWGVIVGTGTVFETKSDRTYQYQPFYPIADYAETDISGQLIDPDMPMLMPLSRELSLGFTSRDGYTAEALLQFGETSGVRPADADDTFTADDASVWGPMPAMVRASRSVYRDGVTEKQSVIIVSASTELFGQLALENGSLSNSEYLLKLIADLTGNEQTVAIAPKSLAGKTLGITSRQVTTLGVVLGGVVPLCILLLGLGVWLYRRYQ